MPLASTVAGFSVLPVSYTSSSSTHYIYARPHATSKKNATAISSSLPDGRTLFLVNVPPDATERELVLLFKAAGTVEKVVFDKDALVEPDDSDVSDEEEEEEEGTDDDEQPRKRRKLDKQRPPKVVPLPAAAIRRLRPTGRTAHVVFLDASSLTRALSPQNKPRLWPNSEEPFGLARYAALHAALRPPLDTVRTHADSAMELFEYELAQTKRASKYRKGEAIVDEDGFTLVTRGGAYGQTLGGGVAVASKQFQETGETSARNQNKNKSKNKKEKEGFYAFQKAEKQRNDLMELKKNWEADKAKVEKLKASRRFKPY
ncbi:ribosomal RNA-processing protein 7-domain-containing protein [Roridomyces roridus]|uniref:Ribosomal RNA-processing protein 7-domain-containing protein n=1 Tax=Roridomyces roridus TaxID=1738132 RepID=A0AAD7FME9_9AGAR|nr:ribosomal RNA-processing protein 7-domain-containing protein [Roridomyces roridus]